MKCLPSSTRLMSQFLLLSGSGKGNHLTCSPGSFSARRACTLSGTDVWALVLLHKLNYFYGLSWVLDEIALCLENSEKYILSCWMSLLCLCWPGLFLILSPLSFIFDHTWQVLLDSWLHLISFLNLALWPCGQNSLKRTWVLRAELIWAVPQTSRCVGVTGFNPSGKREWVAQ